MVLAFTAAACGGSEPTVRPSPTPPASQAPPPPTNIAISGTITSTVGGQRIGTFSRTVTALPAQVSVSLPGYITRDTWITTAQPTLDLLPESGFDLAFYRQFARNGFDAPTQLQPLRPLMQAPAFYMEVEGAKGLSAATAARVERVARRLVPLMTGGRFQVTVWQTGPTSRPPQPGWITIERKDDLAGPDVPSTQQVCGRAFVGAAAGQIWLNGDSRCQWDALFAHEIGHALGFWHVEQPGAMMFPREYGGPAPDEPTERERHHAALVYARTPGNQDIDRDPQRPTVFATPMMVD